MPCFDDEFDIVCEEVIDIDAELRFWEFCTQFGENVDN